MFEEMFIVSYGLHRAQPEGLFASTSPCFLAGPFQARDVQILKSPFFFQCPS
jgi:hypothetical protein